MVAIKPHNRRVYTTVALVLVVALSGLVMLTVGDASADNSSLAALQQKADHGAATISAQPVSPYGALVKMIAALVVVIASIYGGLYLLNRQMKRRQYGRTGGRSLDVLETAFVGPKKTVSLVRVADRAVLIGVTDNQISVLTELSEPETARILAEQPQPSQETFGSLLNSAVDRVKKLRGREALARA